MKHAAIFVCTETQLQTALCYSYTFILWRLEPNGALGPHSVGLLWTSDQPNAETPT